MKDQDGQVIQYIDGYAWGVASDGRTVCLGPETYIRALLFGPRKHTSDAMIAQIIWVERQLLKKLGKEEQEKQGEKEAEKQERHQRAVELGVAKTKGNRGKTKVVPKK